MIAGSAATKLNIPQPTADEQEEILGNMVERDLRILAPYIGKLVELAWGVRRPRSEAQLHFVAFASGREQPSTPYEHAFDTFLMVLKGRRAEARKRYAQPEHCQTDAPQYEEGMPRPGWENLRKYQ
jgi:uncharacterized protein YifE (UPF0438 family)